MWGSLGQALEDLRRALTGAEPTTAVPAATEAPKEARQALPAPEGSQGPAEERGLVKPTAPQPAGAVEEGGRPRWTLWAGIGGPTLLVGLWLSGWLPWSAPEPADPEVVASYQGGVVSREQLRRRIESLPKPQQAAYRRVEGLRALGAEAVVHEVARRWAEEKQIDRKELFKDAMRHATEEVQIADVSEQLHEGRIEAGEAEIQAYYDRNRGQLGDRPLVEVREQIRHAVVQGKERGFVDAYLKELRERASLQVDYSLLEVPEPSEREVGAYYQAQRETFRVPEEVTIAQIQVSLSLAGGDEKARQKAMAARARVEAGEEFGQVARETSDGPERAQGGRVRAAVPRGARDPAFDEAVFPLPVEGLSPAFKEGDSYYVVKVLERRPERLRTYEEVRAEIAARLRAEQERQVYAERQDRTLFTIHSRRTTFGEFLHELNELPPAARTQYAGAEGKRRLLERLIDRLVVVEDASDQATEVKRKEEIEHVRSDLLAQLLHQEEVDEKAQVADDEIWAEYQRNRSRYAEPAKVRVRYIRVSRGRTPDEEARVRARIEEAESKVKPQGFFGGGGTPADFAEVAGQYSEDPETAAKGGELDRWLGESRNPLDELFEHPLHEALLPLKVGDLSPILALGDSYYLFQIIDKQEARQRSFEEAKELVRQGLRARKHEDLARNMDRQLLERMQLRVYDSRLQALAAELGQATLVPR